MTDIAKMVMTVSKAVQENIDKLDEEYQVLYNDMVRIGNETPFNEVKYLEAEDKASKFLNNMEVLVIEDFIRQLKMTHFLMSKRYE